MKQVLVFGSNGSIGNYIFSQFENGIENYKVTGTTTNTEKTNEKTIYVTSNFLDNLKLVDDIDIVIWSQGYNFNDNIENFDIVNFQKIMLKWLS